MCAHVCVCTDKVACCVLSSSRVFFCFFFFFFCFFCWMWADWMWSPSHSHSVGENVTAQGDTRTWGLLFDTSEESTWHSTGICGRWSPQRYDTKYSMLNNSSEKRGFVLILNKKNVFQFRLMRRFECSKISSTVTIFSVKCPTFFFFCRYHFHGSSTGKHKGGILYWKTNFGLWSVRLLKMGSWDLQGSLRGIPGVLSKKMYFNYNSIHK